MRERVHAVVTSRRFQQLIVVVILVNAATLGLETVPAIAAGHEATLKVIDHAALYVFVAELLAKIYAERSRFLRDPWNIFDALIVAIALVPSTGGLSVLRSLRILRALRLLSVVPSLRRVVSALLRAMPGMSSIVVLLGLVLYVAGVMATKLYGGAAPERFGSLPASLFTLFQTMTGDDWGNIARQVMTLHPSAWIFFTAFILISTFIVLNLFMAVVVSAMDEESAGERAELRGLGDESAASTRAILDESAASTRAILEELAALRREVAALRRDGVLDGPRQGLSTGAQRE
ncbi:ion transporter [Nonomuraea roseoviolacea]|uniref:Voltage-gated sodium channel n=2 Tax=Nonomuraea TaxID=83681 RepID=A0ABT1KG38_9ACTN|nr:ion transporter [Nonomuraea roseoviolacea]MCP2352617.1 voltage-gated sodium channel [Nonomuraea roseoviolacea subsp. carminata]